MFVIELLFLLAFPLLLACGASYLTWGGVVAASGVPHRCYGSPVPSLRGADVAAKPGARRLHPLHPAARRGSCIRAVVPVAPAVQNSTRRVRSCCSSGVGGAVAGIQKGARQ